MSTLAEVILRDTRANQPAAGSTPAGTLYYVTDESVLERCTGAAWESYSAAAGLSNPMTTAGDVIYGGASGTPTRLGKGTDGQYLMTSNSAVAWATVSGSAYVGCKAYNNTTQGSLSSGVNALTMNSEDWDTSSFHDTSTNPSRFTIPTTGYYRMNGGGYLSLAGNFYWRVGGSTLLGGTVYITTPAQASIAVATAHLTAGQYVELVEYHASGTATAGHASARQVQIEGTVEYLGS